ncbi:hypothetical protein VPNG_09562 [Cytospora leucostoma]|uniref:UBX domain-containing protein 2 n=1 Tax=Cytospora leucostoma TaxID=1230097 RepID=A0A423VQD4_9PEZI|nr:hypothetical protein VPNG_09562 [Cytospora leucostoma]
MFFTGTLQEGISKALQESKLVVCFVTDNADESKTWEDDYLKDNTIAPSLETDAVLLRLEAGSQETGYLAAIFPLPKNPTLVIIKNGELKEYISAGTSREQFITRVSGAFQAQALAQSQSQSQAGGANAPTGDSAASTAAASTGPQHPSNSQIPGQDTPAPPASNHLPAANNTLTQEGEARRQAARKERDEAEKRRREKGKANEEGSQNQDPEKARQDDTKKKAAQQLAERHRKAREERARVLKRIEDDKAERRARDEARRAERRAAATAAADAVDVDEVTAAAGEPAPASASTSSTIRRQHDQCAIQVRLFDGSTIRSRFPAGATLAREVRGWIDGARADDNNSPYTFRVILTPLPNRIIDPAAEEGQTLGELGLTPSATLVLAPAERYSRAYPRASESPVSRLIAAVLAFVGSILGAIAGTLTGSGRRGERGDEGGGQESIELQERRSQQGHATGRDGGSGSGSRIKGFEDRDDRQKDHQFYNGNSLNFEPRKDEDDKDK